MPIYPVRKGPSWRMLWKYTRAGRDHSASLGAGRYSSTCRSLHQSGWYCLQDKIRFTSRKLKGFRSRRRATRRHGINGSPVLGIKIGDVENHDDRYHVRSRRDPAGVNRHPTSSTFKHCPVAGVASRRENGGLAPETRRTLPAYEGTRTRGPHAPPWIDGCLEPACRGYMITI